MNFNKFIEYKREQAKVRKAIREAKRNYWKGYCETIGRKTPINEVWGVIKKMSGVKSNWSYPVLNHEGALAISDEEKANMMANVLAKVHSNENLTEEDKMERNKTHTQNQSSLESNVEQEDSVNTTFSLNELKKSNK